MNSFRAPEYAPDIMRVTANVTDDVINLFPTSTGYGPVAGPRLVAEGLEDLEVTALFSGFSTSFGPILVVADSTNLYLYEHVGKSWVNVNNPARVYYSVGSAKWSFALFGPYLIAVHPYNVPQCLDLRKLECFQDLAGNPPIARYVAVWENFVVLLQLADHPERIMWSGLNDIECWEAGKKSCDYQDFPGGGAIQAASSSINPLIFAENAIYKAIFMPGSAYIFRFQRLHVFQTALKADSINGRDGFYFFISAQQLWQITESGSLKQIGRDRIDKSILNSALTTHTLYIDYLGPRLYCLVKKVGTNWSDRILVYDWELDKFSLLNLSVQSFLMLAPSVLTLEELDKSYASIDGIETSLDFIDVTVKKLVLGVFAADNKLYSLDGEILPAQLTTQFFNGLEGNKQILGYLQPFTDNSRWLAEVIIYDDIYDSKPKASTLIACQQGKSRYLVHKRGRVHRIRFKFSNQIAWQHFEGFKIQFQPAGK